MVGFDCSFGLFLDYRLHFCAVTTTLLFFDTFSLNCMHNFIFLVTRLARADSLVRGPDLLETWSPTNSFESRLSARISERHYRFRHRRS